MKVFCNDETEQAQQKRGIKGERARTNGYPTRFIPSRIGFEKNDVFHLEIRKGPVALTRVTLIPPALCAKKGKKNSFQASHPFSSHQNRQANGISALTPLAHYFSRIPIHDAGHFHLL